MAFRELRLNHLAHVCQQQCFHWTQLKLNSWTAVFPCLYTQQGQICHLRNHVKLFHQQSISWAARSWPASQICDPTRNLYTACRLLKQPEKPSNEMILNDYRERGDDIMREAEREVSDLYEDQYLNPLNGHKVLIIHPVTKMPRNITDCDLEVFNKYQLAESCSLIEALPEWCIVGKEVVPLSQIDKSNFFSKGIFYQVSSVINQYSQKTAVFVDVSMLSGLQLSVLQKAWSVPVYDRYTIILQIFHIRARTTEAKLQLMLAEMPYYRSRLRGMHMGSLDKQRGGLNYIGGSGETFIEKRYRVIAEKELSIRKKLESLRKKRHLLWQERKKKELPLVAIVGYTNAGKTSLIKALTKDTTLEPWDQVFATLDVTCHAGYLGNRMKVIYMDTVGFISNIPTGLIESFSATLEDITRADLIIHVKDVSHPQVEQQRATVLQTLASLKLDQKLLDSVIEVNNKADLISSSEMEYPNGLCVSTLTGEGIPKLMELVEKSVLEHTDHVEKVFKIPQSGPHLAWLYKEATVESSRPCGDDKESILVRVVMTTGTLERFRAKFSSKKKRKKHVQ